MGSKKLTHLASLLVVVCCDIPWWVGTARRLYCVRRAKLVRKLPADQMRSNTLAAFAATRKQNSINRKESGTC